MTIKRSIYLPLFILLAACSSNQTKEESSGEEITSEPNYVGEEVSYTTDSITMKGYLAYDENTNEKRPGVIVVHEWWGHNEYTRERADMLAELGYVAIAVDMYGDGKQAAHPDDAGKFAMAVMSNMDLAKARFTKALETLKSNDRVDADKIAAIGYCFGGSVVLTMASAGMDLDAVAAFHSGVQLPVQPEEGVVKAKILVCNGADDPFVQAEHVEAFKAAMDSAKVDYKYIAYEGVVHSFTSKAADSVGQKFDMPLAYDAEADQQSWDELKSLLNEVFE